MKIKTSLLAKIFFFLSTASALVSWFVATNSTNDCNLADIILMLAFPGFLFLIGGVAIRIRQFNIKKESKVWVLPILLMAGFLWVGFERAALERESAERCDDQADLGVSF